MKKILLFLSTFTFLISCGVRVPYTNDLRDEFSLDTEEKMRNVQFLISQTIVLDQELSDTQNTTENGTLIASSNSKKETVVITKCIFESFGTKGEIFVRFETGDQKTLIFSAKTEGNRNKRYYFEADWSAQGGAKIKYGGNIFKVSLIRGSARSSYIEVVKKNLQKSRRKERVVKGLKV